MSEPNQEKAPVQEPNQNFNLPAFILTTLTWTARILVYIQLFNSDASIFNMILSILLFLVMEIVIGSVIYLIKYIPIVKNNPSLWLDLTKNKDIIEDDIETSNFIDFIITLAYILIFFH